MIAFGVGAALLAAVTGAASHSLLKAGRDKLVIRGLIALTSSLAVVPVMPFVPLPSAALWPWLIIAGLLHTVYQFVLVAAYDAAEFSVAYPLARGLVPVSTATVGILFLGDDLTIGTTIGITAVTTGLLLIAARSGVSWAGLGWAALAGLLTTIYTAVDGHAVRLAPVAATFIVWFFIMDGLMMVPLVSWLRRGRILLLARAEGRQGVAAGLFALVGYGAALVALRLLPVGAASALRETSVVFGVLIARFWLGEVVDSRKLGGVALIAVGGMVIVGALAQ